MIALYFSVILCYCLYKGSCGCALKPLVSLIAGGALSIWTLLTTLFSSSHGSSMAEGRRRGRRAAVAANLLDFGSEARALLWAR